MRHVVSQRRVPRHHLMFHRPPQRRDTAGRQPVRASELILALLAVVMLGGFALAAALAFAARTLAP